MKDCKQFINSNWMYMELVEAAAAFLRLADLGTLNNSLELFICEFKSDMLFNDLKNAK